MRSTVYACFLVFVILLSACGDNETPTVDLPEPIPEPTEPITVITTPLTIGVFDETRAGSFNFADSSTQADFRKALRSAFPNMKFLRIEALSDASLEGVDVLMLSSAKNNSQAVDALSAAEQLALKSFVEAGGGALLFVDNDSFGGRDSDVVNESFLDPFALDVSGSLKGEQNVVVLPLDNPITKGSFGRVENFKVLFPGYFEVLGQPALNLAMLDDNGEAALVYLMRGALTTGSGGVSFFSDSNLTAEMFDENVGRLIKNALAYAAGF